MATSPSHLHLKEVDGQSNISKDAWRWHGHFSIPYKGVWMATPLSLRRNGDGMASTPFHSIHTPFNGMERWPCHHHSSLEIMEWQSTPLYMEWRSGHAIARLPQTYWIVHPPPLDGDGMEKWPCHHHSSLEIMELPSTPRYMEWRSGHAPLAGIPSPFLLRNNGVAIHTPLDGMEKLPSHHHLSFEIMDQPSTPLQLGSLHHSSLETMEWPPTPPQMEWRSYHPITIPPER